MSGGEQLGVHLGGHGDHEGPSKARRFPQVMLFHGAARGGSAMEGCAWKDGKRG